MTLPVKNNVRQRPVAEADVVYALNEEIVPTLREVRDGVNLRLGAYRSVAEDDAIELTDEVLLVDCTDGPVTLTLPAAADWTRRLLVMKTDASANAVTVETLAGETVNGVASTNWNTQYDGREFISDATQYLSWSVA